MEMLAGAAYFAPHAWVRHVEREVGRPSRRYGALVVRIDRAPASAWAQSIWQPLYRLRFDSVQSAQSQLSSLGERWSSYFWTLEDQGQAIAAGLKTARPRTLNYPTTWPTTDLGAWTIIDDTTILAAPRTSHPLPGGQVKLAANRHDPPSSAYLKLQEALLRIGYLPEPGALCLDAGASPGGWTWVLRQTGATVLAIDRSPLDPRLMSDPLVSFTRGNALAQRPQELPLMDLVCSDLICYPSVIWEWVDGWLQSGRTKRLVVTIKMQGEPDWTTIERFRAVPESKLFHGSYNKHELTWCWPVLDQR